MQKQSANSVVWIYWISFVISLCIFGFGIYQAMTMHMWVLLATGCACVVGVLVTWPLAIALQETRDINCKQFEEIITPLNERMEQISVMLNLISEQQLLSDRAKAVAFREKDREALRRAIQEELGRHDYEAAALLADDIEKSFGYRAEAMRWREQIAEKRNEAVRRQIGDAMSQVDRHVRSEKWQEAHFEAQKIQAQYPDLDLVRKLHDDINARKEQHKQQLIESLREADVARRRRRRRGDPQKARRLSHARRSREHAGPGPARLQAPPRESPHAILDVGSGTQLGRGDPSERGRHPRLSEHTNGQGMPRGAAESQATRRGSGTGERVTRV